MSPWPGLLFDNALSGYLFRCPTKVEVVPQSGPCRRWMMIDAVLLPFRAIVGRGVMYKYKIGERLFPARSCGLIVRNGAYVIVKRLPMRDGEFEYQIRSTSERDDSVR